MIKIHHVEGTRSQRIAWVLEELGLPYDLSFRPGDARGSMADLAKRHPMHMSPIIEDGETVLIESGAIIEYILRLYGDGRLTPSVASPDYLRYLQYMHFAEGSAMFRIAPHLLAGMRGDPPLEGRENDRFRDMMAFLDAEVAERPYFAGDDFTAADIMMEFPLKLVALVPGGFEPYPHISAHLDRLHARPAYERAMAAALPNGAPAR